MEILFFSVIFSLFGHLVYGQACPPGIDVAQMCVPGQVSGRRVLIDTTTYRPDIGNCSCAFSTTSGVMKIVTGVAPNKQGCDSAIRLSSSSGNSMRFQCLMSGTYLDTSVHRDGAVTFEAYSQVYDTNYCLSIDATAGETVTVTCTSDFVVEKSTSQIGDTTTTPAPVTSTSTSRTSTGDLVTSSAGPMTTSAGTKTSLADETTTFKTTPAYFMPEPMPTDIETNGTVGADTHNSSNIKTSTNDDIITSINEKSATDTVSTMFTHPGLNSSVNDTMEQVVNNTAAINHQSFAVEPVISETNNVDAQITIVETNVTEKSNNTVSTVMDNTNNMSVNNTANVDKENMTSKYSTNVIEEAAKDLYMTTPRSIYVEPVTTAAQDTVSNGSTLNEMYNNQNKTSESVPNDLMMSTFETSMTVEHFVVGTAAPGSNVDSTMSNEQAGLKTNVNMSSESTELFESTGNQSISLETHATNDQTSNASYSVDVNSSSTPVPSVAMRSQPDQNLELTFPTANPIRETKFAHQETTTTVNESHLGNGNAMLADNETHFMKPIRETTLSQDIPSTPTPVPYEGMRSQPNENFELTFPTANPIRETKFANQETTTTVNAFELGNGNAMFADNETHSMIPIIETTLSQDIPSTTAPVFLRPDAVSGGLSNNSQDSFIGANTMLEKHDSEFNGYVDTNISLDSLSLNGMVAAIDQTMDVVPNNAASNASVSLNSLTSNASNEPVPSEGMRSQPGENFELTFPTANPIRETKFANQETTTTVNAFVLGNGNAMFVDNETHSMKPIIETTLSQDIPSTPAPVFLRPDAVSGGLSNNSQDSFIGANTMLEKHDSEVNGYVDTNISLDSLSLNGMVAAIDQTMDVVPDNAASNASVTENNLTSNASNEPVPSEGMRSQPGENFELTFPTANPIRETKFANQETTTTVNAFELGNGNAMFVDNETHSMKPIIETTLSQDIPSTPAPVFLRSDAVSGGISNNSQDSFIGANTMLEKHDSEVNDYVDTNISLDSLSLNGMVAAIDQTINVVPDNAASNVSVTENNLTSYASNESVIITKQYNGAYNAPIVSESLLSVDPISSTTQRNPVSESNSFISSSASVEMTSSTLTPVSETLGSAGQSAVLSSFGVTNHYNEVMLKATAIQYNDTSSMYSVNDNNTEQTDGSTYLLNVNEKKLSSKTITPPSVVNNSTQRVPIHEEFIANDFINVHQAGKVANLADEQTTATGLTTQDFKTKTDATGTTEDPVLAKIHNEMFISNVQPSLSQQELMQTSIEVTTNHVTVSKTSTVKQDQTSAIEILGQGTTEAFVHEKQTEESATMVHSTRSSIVSEQQTSELGTTERRTEPTTSGPTAQTVNSTQLITGVRDASIAEQVEGTTPENIQNLGIESTTHSVSDTSTTLREDNIQTSTDIPAAIAATTAIDSTTQNIKSFNETTVVPEVIAPVNLQDIEAVPMEKSVVPTKTPSVPTETPVVHTEILTSEKPEVSTEKAVTNGTLKDFAGAVREPIVVEDAIEPTETIPVDGARGGKDMNVAFDTQADDSAPFEMSNDAYIIVVGAIVGLVVLATVIGIYCHNSRKKRSDKVDISGDNQTDHQNRAFENDLDNAEQGTNIQNGGKHTASSENGGKSAENN